MKADKFRKTTLTGSVISAFLASACCIGPVVFALLGIGGAGFISQFEEYRPLFIVISVLFLGTGFYFTYRKKSECGADSSCANSKSDRINKVVLWAAVSLVAVFTFFPSIAALSENNVQMPDQSKGEFVERYYFVRGMTCSGCNFSVKKALKRAGLTDDQILEVDFSSPDPKRKIGHAKVRFPVKQYKGKETDCRIVKQIKENPGYMVYLEPDNPNPCGDSGCC
ncbi:MAG: mercuric transporter MerT family protein [bacterium]